MRNCLVTGACLMLLMGGAAYAEEAPQKEVPQADTQQKEVPQADDQYIACEAALSRAEKRVDDTIEAKRLSEGDADQVNKLLDEADALCTERKYAEATKTLADVDKQVSAAAKPSQPSE